MRHVLLFIGITPIGLGAAYEFTRRQTDPSSCVAPVEYEKCNKEAWVTIDNYYSRKKRDADENICFAYANLLNCEGQYCWNKVYGCEYNDLVQLLLGVCDSSIVNTNGIPFWPAPANAPGACSCDHSAADLANANLWSTTHNACSTGEVEDPNDKNSTWNCVCCYWSLSFVALMQSCPKYDFPYLRYDDARKQNLTNFDETYFSCQDTLPTANCKALGYNFTGEVPLPSNLPLPGTETMSNLAGQVTAPVSGWTYSWSVAGFELTVPAFSPTGTIVNVLASTNVVSGSGAASGVSSGTGTITTGPTRATSAANSSPTTSTSGAWRVTNAKMAVRGFAACVLFQASLALWF